ncbi:MAG: dihydroorotate dehydrogenase electron transfer subunit [Patescibacteria group bacterium]
MPVGKQCLHQKNQSSLNQHQTKQKRIEDLKIVKNKKLNSDYFIIELVSSKTLPEILPGQFAEVIIKNSKNTFLRRPLSVHNVNYNKNTISLLIKIVGEGTSQLALLKKDNFLNLVYPLGNGFSTNNPTRVLLVGGGCGIAPLLYLAKILNSKKYEVDIIIGVRKSTDLILIDKYSKYGKVYITTEDGSTGEKGFVINHSIFSQLNNYSMIYACGPEIMMKAVVRCAHKAKINCEVSLENLMACGIGVCLCCVTNTIVGHKCVCTEGPVFNSKDLLW